MEDKQTIDIIAILGILLTLVFGVIAVVQTYRANKLNREVAKKQGALETPNIEISLFDKQRIEHFMIALPLTKGKILEMPLVFLLANTGGKSAKELELFIRMSKELSYGGSDQLGRTIISNSKLETATFEVLKQTDYLETIRIKFEKTLHPNQAIQLNQPISLRQDTSLRSKITATTKDGVRVNVSYTAYLEFVLDFVLMQTDQKPISKRFFIEVINTSKTSVETFFRNRNKEMQKERRRIGFWKTVFRRLFYKPTKSQEYKFILVQVDKKYIESDSSLPINRVSYKAYLSFCEGLQLKNSYFIPALNIWTLD